MTQNQQGAAAPKISYGLSNFAPNEVQFLLDMISNVPQPLVVTQPIYQKIVNQVQAQDKAREEAAKQKQTGGQGKAEPPVKSTPNLTPPKAPRAKTK